MRIGIVSDTHRMENFINKAIPYLKECDLIIHAGDNFIDSKYIHKMTGIDIIAVKGNCDFEHIEDEIIFYIEDKTIFLCHGDNYGVKYGLNEIERAAINYEANIVIFGHTHIPLSIKKDNIIYINPGSTSIPRGGSSRQFVIMNIDEGKINLEEINI
ncbi:MULTISPECIES: metallophosphoesterase family protein [unclassified Romboutsia]|uniref:metallophosphoesterase family protein n=1 Tax=unclassified Romboutsia TaxID=2626894 RepID=UPI000820C11A|nr:MULTISPECIES: metallophosphoesterase [unclassified Romboutsia]SCI21566.1 Phosphodiesterase yfcE [uncultured Clostridium sp.]